MGNRMSCFVEIIENKRQNNMIKTTNEKRGRVKEMKKKKNLNDTQK